MRLSLRRPAALALVAPALTALAAPALAHHPLGGGTPATFAQGFLSGVGHPMLGLDHFAFIVAMGLIAAMAGRLALLPLAFVAASAIGTLGTTLGLALPFGEIVVAATATLAGALVLSGRAPSAAAAAALFAGAGLFHGWAFGAAVIGAEPTPVAAYLTGLAATQYAIAVGTGLIARVLWRETGAGVAQTRLAGAVAAGVGFAFLFEALETLAFGPIA
jgi:urease accessory protein